MHFSMMVAGVQIDPKEWWDEHWIQDRILSKIGSAGSTQTAAVKTTPVAALAGNHKRGHKR